MKKSRFLDTVVVCGFLLLVAVALLMKFADGAKWFSGFSFGLFCLAAGAWLGVTVMYIVLSPEPEKRSKFAGVSASAFAITVALAACLTAQQTLASTQAATLVNSGPVVRVVVSGPASNAVVNVTVLDGQQLTPSQQEELKVLIQERVNDPKRGDGAETNLWQWIAARLSWRVVCVIGGGIAAIYTYYKVSYALAKSQIDTHKSDIQRQLDEMDNPGVRVHSQAALFSGERTLAGNESIRLSSNAPPVIVWWQMPQTAEGGAAVKLVAVQPTPERWIGFENYAAWWGLNPATTNTTYSSNGAPCGPLEGIVYDPVAETFTVSTDTAATSTNNITFELELLRADEIGGLIIPAEPSFVLLRASALAGKKQFVSIAGLDGAFLRLNFPQQNQR